MPFDYDKVKHILVCPVTKADLIHDGETLVCADPEARHQFPIVDEIPRLLIDEATQLSVEDWGAAMKRHGRDTATGQLM